MENDPSKINKHKRKQSSLSAAAISMGVSVDVIERLAPVIYAYARFIETPDREHLNFVSDYLEITKLEAHDAYLVSEISKLKNNKKSNGQN